MKQRAIDLKEWSLAKFTPLAWSRITLRALPTLNGFGIELDQIQDPPADMYLTGAALEAIHDAIMELYSVEVPVNVNAG